MAWRKWTRAGVLVLVATMRAGITSGEVVEASTVSNVVVTASKWDLRGAVKGGCGVAGCDPRLTRDGEDNTVADSRWSCKPDLASESSECWLKFDISADFTVPYVTIYFHESDDETQVALFFTVATCEAGFYGCSDVTVFSGLTSPGTALGEGQRINFPATSPVSKYVNFLFDLPNDQWINVSETPSTNLCLYPDRDDVQCVVSLEELVKIYLDVTDSDDVIIPTQATTSVVRANTITNVVASASKWDLRSDAGCGAAGCDPRLTRDGNDNTVAASRWSCIGGNPENRYSTTEDCILLFEFDDYNTVSYIVIYVHDSDDATKTAISFETRTCSSIQLCEYRSEREGLHTTTPGTELGAGERFNLPRPETLAVGIFPNVTEGQWIDISEVEIYLEVLETNVMVSAAKAWVEVSAETVTTVTAVASVSTAGFGPSMTRDGDDNTVSASRWSCEPSLGGRDGCELVFLFSDEYTVSYLVIYVHESNDATKTPIMLEAYPCTHYGLTFASVTCDTDNIVGSYMTEPGTALGTGERVNLLRPTTSAISIYYPNITAGQYVNISEVEIYIEVPDSTPTPAPFVPSPDTDMPTSSYDDSTNSRYVASDDIDSSLSSTSVDIATDDIDSSLSSTSVDTATDGVNSSLSSTSVDIATDDMDRASSSSATSPIPNITDTAGGSRRATSSGGRGFSVIAVTAIIYVLGASTM